MKKMLLVLSLLAVASLSASATTGYTVQFTGFCDGMQIANYTNPIFGGTHLLGDCANNFFGGGFRHAAAGYTVYPGAAFDFSDPLFGLFGINSSLQFLLQVTGTVRRPGICGWAIYEGPDGVGNYLLNAGSCTLVSRPSPIVKGLKSSTGR